MQTLLSILTVHDGKPGHRAQVEGLADAIGRLRGVLHVEHDTSAPEKTEGLLEKTPPRLVICAGRKAAIPAAELAEAFGAKSVALMNPGWLKRRLFNLVVAPRHDGLKECDRVLLTDGALNAIEPAPEAPLVQGLILVGGPSAHHLWDGADLVAQLRWILEHSPGMRFHATSSRRTPDATLSDLLQLSMDFKDTLQFTPSTDTPRGWVAGQLQACGTCWVSEDSVSMVYEALSAGAATGLLRVPAKQKCFGLRGPGRVVRGVRDLAVRRKVTTFDDFAKGTPLARHAPMQEADRIAAEILRLWPEM